MPARPSGGGSRPRSKGKKKEERSFWDKLPGSKIASQTVKDLGNIARTAPAGVVDAGKAFAALQHGDPREMSQLWKNQVYGVKDVVQDPLKNPGYTLVTALGLAPVPGAAAARVSRVVKKTPKAKPRTRKLSYRPKNEKEAKLFQQVSGSKKAKVTEQTVHLPRSKVNTTARAQDALDLLRSKNDRWQRSKVLKGVARDRDILSRRDNPDVQEGIIDASKRAVSKQNFRDWFEEWKKHPIRETVAEGNAAVRGARLYRFGYVPPNKMGAVATNLIEGPIRSTKANLAMQRLRGESPKQRYMNRDLAPDRAKAFDQVDALLGEGAAQGATELVGGGPAATFMRGVGQTLGKVTDRQQRRTHFGREAMEQGYDIANKNPEIAFSELQRLLRSRNDLIQVVRRAEPAAIRFTRSRNLKGVPQSKLQRIDAAAARNVFLYRWLTGSAAFTGRMLTEHPTLSMMLANQGKNASGIEDVLDEYPEFMDRYIPAGVRGKLPMVSNLQAATLFDSPGEFLDLLGRVKEDPRNAIDPLAPVQRGAGVAWQGYDPFREQELATRSNPNPSPWERIKFGADVETRSIPHKTLFEGLTMSDEEREGKLFPRTTEDLLKTYFFGGPTPTPVNPEVAKSMARSQKSKKSGTRSGARKRSQGF